VTNIAEPLLDHPRLGLWVWNISDDTVIWTKSLFNIFGLEQCEILPNWKHHARFYTPESFEKLHSAVSRCLNTEKQEKLRLDGVHASGMGLHLEVYIDTERGANGVISRIFGKLVNITEEINKELELQRTKEELLRRNSLLEALLKSSQDGLLLVDQDGRRIHHNERLIRLLELPPEVILDPNYKIQRQWMPGIVKHPADFLERIHQLYEEPDKTGSDLVELKNGVTLKRFSSLVSGHDGGILGRVWVYHDITEEISKQRDLEEAIEKAHSSDRAKSEFLGVMSHELRTPLNGILGFANLILEEKDLAHDLRDNVAMIESSGQSLLRMLEDILDFSQVEGGWVKLQKIPFSLSEISWRAIRLVETDAKAKNLHLFVILGEDLPGTVQGDPDRIHQVLLNLLRNAIKFTDHGTVTLRVSLSSQEKNSFQVYFAVEDTGPGIQEDQQEKIFLPFTQADSSFSRHFNGIGLGLTISKRLLERMGSTLCLKSQRDKGSTFSFELLLPADTSTKEIKREGGSDLGKLDRDFARRFPTRILVVEDNPVNLHLAAKLLKNLGYEEIQEAANGEEALSLLDHEKIDLIFMDLQMPGIDGLEATRRIRSQEAENLLVAPKIIVALTANASPTIRNECFEAGMNLYISKPFNTRFLAEAIALQR